MRAIINTHTGKIISDTDLQLEYLYVGDYGKENNIKADFLGYTKRIELENLRALSMGNIASLTDKDKARKWSEKIADMAYVNSPLPNIFQTAKNVVDNEINRLNELIDTTDVNP